MPIIHDISASAHQDTRRLKPLYKAKEKLFSNTLIFEEYWGFAGDFLLFCRDFWILGKPRWPLINENIHFLVESEKSHAYIYIRTLFVYAYSVVGTFSGVPISHCMLNSNRRKTHGKKNR